MTVHFAGFMDADGRTLCGVNNASPVSLNCDRVTCQRCRQTNLFKSCNIGRDYHGDTADRRTAEMLS